MLRRGKYVAKEFGSPPVRGPTTPFSGGVFVFGGGHGWLLSTDSDRRNNAYSRLRSHELSPAIGPVPVLQWVSPVVTIIVLFPLTGVAGTCRNGGLSESWSGNERCQGQSHRLRAPPIHPRRLRYLRSCR